MKTLKVIIIAIVILSNFSKAKACVLSAQDMEANGVPTSLVSFALTTHRLESCASGWSAVNQFGCCGAFQFCGSTFRSYARKIGYSGNCASFVSNPKAQVAMFLALLRDNWGAVGPAKSCLGKETCNTGKALRRAGVGSTDCGIITNSSLLLGAHLGGAGRVNTFARNGCTSTFTDANGAAITGYMLAGRCHDVSYVTGSAPDVTLGDRECTLIAGQPYDPEKNPLLPGIVSSDVNPQKPGTSPPINCVNLRLQRALTLAAMDFKHAATAAALDTYRKMKYNDKGGCLIEIMSYFNSITNILQSVVSMVAGIIISILNAVLNKICDFIITGINNLLAMICLPVPNIGFDFNLSLPSLQKQTCNGVSLGNFISVGGGYSGYYGGAFPGSVNPMMLIEPRRSRKTTNPVF